VRVLLWHAPSCNERLLDGGAFMAAARMVLPLAGAQALGLPAV